MGDSGIVMIFMVLARIFYVFITGLFVGARRRRIRERNWDREWVEVMPLSPKPPTSSRTIPATLKSVRFLLLLVLMDNSRPLSRLDWESTFGQPFLEVKRHLFLEPGQDMAVRVLSV